MLFPLPRHLPKRNSVRQVDTALQTGALSNTALYRIAGAAGAELRSAVLARSFLGQSFQLSFNCIRRVSDVPHRFRKPFLRYIEFVGPVLNFMGLKQADSASILRTPLGEIIWHSFSPPEATRGRAGKFPVLAFVAPRPHSAGVFVSSRQRSPSGSRACRSAPRFLGTIDLVFGRNLPLARNLANAPLVSGRTRGCAIK